MAPKEEEVTYERKDAIGDGITATLILAGAGTTVSAIQNALTKQNVSAWGVFTRFGSTITIFSKRFCRTGGLDSRLMKRQLRWEQPMGSRRVLRPIFERRMIAGTQQ